MTLRKYFLSILGCSLISVLSSQAQAALPRIGIDLSTQNEARFYDEGYYLQHKLNEKGFTVDLLYAGDGELPTQKDQIRRLINAGCKILLIGAVDARALDEELAFAKTRGITVIAYDRLLMDTENVDYCVSFNNESSGYLIADYFERKLNLRLHGETNPLYIEIFAGSPDDKSAQFFWDGAMAVMDPFISPMHSVEVKSGETTFEACQIEGWNSYKALQRMERLIKEQNYRPGGQQLDAILSPSDSISQGIALALDAAGFSPENYPIITGQNCEPLSINNMLKGKQAMSIFKDGRQLADAAVQMINEIANGKEVNITNTYSYDNGKKIVPAVEIETQMVDLDNYIEILVDSGYMTKEEIANPYH